MPIDESLIIKLQADVNQYKKEMQSAAGVTQQAQKNIETSVNKITQGIRQSSAGFSGLGRNAGQAGIQIQQFVGQVQGGQSVLLAFSQQATDLGIVLGAPMLGVIAGLGAALVSTLIPALSKTEEQIETLEDRIDNFIKKLGETDRLSVNTVILLQTQKLNQEYDKQFLLVEKLKKEYDDASESFTRFASETNRNLLDKANDKLSEARDKLRGIAEELDLLQERSLENLPITGQVSDEVFDKNLASFQANNQIFLEQAQEFGSFYLELKQNEADAEAEINRQKLEKISAQERQAAQLREQQEKRAAMARQLIQLSSARSIISGLGALNSAFLEDNKAFNAGLIIADTAAAAIAAYKAGASTGIPGAGEAAAFKALAFGAAQLAANNSASKGGGSISGGAGGGATPTEQPTGQTTVEVSDIATNQTQVVRIELEGLDTFIEGVSKKIDEGKANGSL